MPDRRSQTAPAGRSLRILLSFPTRLGTPGIGTTGWYQAAELPAHGVELTVACATLERPLPAGVRVVETLRPLGVRVPFRALGFDRTVALHDRRVAALVKGFDVVHCWPSGALRTLGAARATGLPALLERPNAHTRFAYEVVAAEHARLGVAVDPDATHAYDAKRLAREEREYEAATHLLCPSDFVARTFLDAGFAPERILRHRYGFDPARFAAPERAVPERPLHAVFVGSGEPRKGLHYALDAWLSSAAPDAGGRFVICGRIEPAYRELLADRLAHASVEERGHVADPAAVMRDADVLLLPSIEEGSALVTYEARACGCVILVSDRAGAACRPGEDALVHPAGDIAVLREHISSLVAAPERLARLRAASLAGLDDLTWAKAAGALAAAYRTARERIAGDGAPSTLPARMPA